MRTPNPYDADRMDDLRVQQRWQLEVLRSSNLPVLARTEAATSDDAVGLADEAALRWFAGELLEPHQEFITIQARNQQRERVYRIASRLDTDRWLYTAASSIVNRITFDDVGPVGVPETRERDQALRDAVALLDVAEAMVPSSAST